MLVKGGTVVRWLGSGCGFGWRCGLFLYEYTSAHYNDNIIVSLRGNPHICKISLYVEMGQVHGSIEDCRMTLIYSVVMYYKMRKHYYSYDSCISTVHPIWYTVDLMCVVLSWLYFHFLVGVCKLFGLLYRRWGNQMNSSIKFHIAMIRRTHDRLIFITGKTDWDWDKVIQHSITEYRCMIQTHNILYASFGTNMISSNRPVLVVHAEATLVRKNIHCTAYKKCWHHCKLIVNKWSVMWTECKIIWR